MAKFTIAVADSVFPNLDPATAVLSAIGGELKLASDSSSEAVLRVAADADAVPTSLKPSRWQFCASVPLALIADELPV